MAESNVSTACALCGGPLVNRDLDNPDLDNPDLDRGTCHDCRTPKGGSDEQHWLSMHNGDNIIVDRKTGSPRTLFVPQASVSVTGSIQPAILQRTLGIEHWESGLAARILMTCPPRQPKQWTDDDIDPSWEGVMVSLFERLYQLESIDSEDGTRKAVHVRLSPEAKVLWKAYYNCHAEEQSELHGDLSAAWSKLEEYAARLALVIHLTRWAAKDPNLENPDVLNEASMRAGIRMTVWFKAEARRVYKLLSESEAERNARQLVEWIERKGRPLTAREVQQGNRRYRTAPQAEMALNALHREGIGRWENSPVGKPGQPTRFFKLLWMPAVYSTGPTAQNNGRSVDGSMAASPNAKPGENFFEL